MAQLLAIISKSVFEASSKTAAVGDVLPLDRYVSTHKALEPLRAGGRLFLVTVRPPDERLWLVAVLDEPKHDGKAWVSAPNQRPITDVSAHRPTIRFTSNSGMSATRGALGMSLQTPRELTEADVALLLGGKSSPPRRAPAARPTPPPAAAKKVAVKEPPLRAKKASGKDVAASLKAERWDDAMASLLARWKTERSPELAGLIERLSAKVAPAKGWRAAADVDLVSLLASMTDGKFADSLQRIRQLEKLEPDPRVAAALTRLVLTPPFTAQSSREFWNSLFEQLSERHADPRTLAALKPHVAGYLSIFGKTSMGAVIHRKVQTLVTDLAARFPTTLQSDDVAALVALVPTAKAPEVKAKKGGAQTLDALLAAVYANPDDDTPRLVYADALLEAGDPRGDFITLQFKRERGELSPAEQKQEAALQTRHAKAWLGPVGEVLQSKRQVFRRGFLHSAQIRPVSKALPAARNHPVWSTVRELNMSTGGTNERGASLVLQPNALGIRVLTDVVYLVLDELTSASGDGRALEVLELSWLPLAEAEEMGEVSRRGWARLLSGKAFPKLRELRFGYEASNELESLAELWTSPLLSKLDTVRFTPSSYEAGRLFAFAMTHSGKARVVEFDFGTVVATVRGKVVVLETQEDGGRTVDSDLPNVLKGLASREWSEVKVPTGAFTAAQLSAVRKAARGALSEG